MSDTLNQLNNINHWLQSIAPTNSYDNSKKLDIAFLVENVAQYFKQERINLI